MKRGWSQIGTALPEMVTTVETPAILMLPFPLHLHWPLFYPSLLKYNNGGFFLLCPLPHTFTSSWPSSSSFLEWWWAVLLYAAEDTSSCGRLTQPHNCFHYNHLFLLNIFLTVLCLPLYSVLLQSCWFTCLFTVHERNKMRQLPRFSFLWSQSVKLACISYLLTFR